MLIRKKTDVNDMHTVVTNEQGPSRMNFAILSMRAGEEYQCEKNIEKALLILSGSVLAQWDDSSQELQRISLFDQAPVVLHFPYGTGLTICAYVDSQLILVSRTYKGSFTSQVLRPKDYRIEEFGKGEVQGCALRTVRTFFDDASAVDCGLVLGEVVNHPGKWSSYPPHIHPQPEIYHYRFSPSQGFGFAQHGENAYMVRDGDTLIIEPMHAHSQVAAPGYVMYYVWAISHLADNRYGPNSRDFLSTHSWTRDPLAKIWSPQ